MRRWAKALGPGALLAALAPTRFAQEPPAPEGGGGEEVEQAEGGEQHDPVPETQEPPQPEPAPEAGGTGGSPPASEPVVAPTTEPVPSHPAIVWPLSLEAIEQHLRGIVEAHPDVAALESLGRSATGREILALRLGARTSAGGTDEPVLLLADYQGPSSAGPEVMLELAWQLALDFERDERVRNLFTRATLVLAPALDPDARAGAAAPNRSVSFERNFPSGWQPESVRPTSGRVSLSQPETLATARYLTNLRGCAVILGFAAPAPRGTPYPEAELPATDREVFGKLGAALELEGASPLVPWFELGSPGGGLFDFAYQARGIYPLVFSLPAEDELAAGRLSAFEAEVAARVLRCLTLLPRIEIEVEGLERLASDTWQLDVRIQNVGIVPTSSALARHREPLTDVALRLDGAKLVATAKKPSSGAPYTDASFQAHAPLSGGTLAGGEGRWLRLILESGSGAEVRVTAASLWAGTDVVQVTLP